MKIRQGKTMKPGIDSSQYNQSYFEKYDYINFKTLHSLDSFGHIYQEAGSMLKLNQQDKVVDLGCGTGQLAFYLYMKYRCYTWGVDYSKDAIQICQKNLEILGSRQEYAKVKEKIHFILSSNDNLPFFRDVTAVFLVDVLEHLRDNEVDLVLETVKRWKSPGGIYLVIHTDNNLHLRLIRPIFNFLSVISRKKTYAEIRKEKTYDLERHINLTTAGKLKKKLSSHGFGKLKISYAPIDAKVVKLQLGILAEYKFLLRLAFILGKFFFFLRPSFYVLAKYE